MCGATSEITHDGDDQPEEDGCKSHDQVDPLSLPDLLPLHVARDEQKGDEQAYRMV